ncbi:TetR/AcrR family transcriptional regulator C-terminal domain-containing protein [Actinoplanes sp. NBRC 103695]|uniref:TetR/AcrR family transcriptional regulator C-terminal domain-containing protein n=1 Tax=Actinoplanes sp. NBRC 103695 TaxID=3032202 RepID=UPI0024A292BA|nr:TetR/AcrR family transcriptional regulator C-terminal domain-containing protein [Actinoplanes sp. NBRC 103695]GLY94760.1 TetR family transcriptional regulator [Actinoplanes sp. NBRC 103695]
MENEDVDRTLTLLWRRTLGTPQGSRGPKQRVSVDEVIQAGIAVADEEGLLAFSMRKVADRLGLKLMSLYTYVPGRSELIGLMVDEVAGERELPELVGSLRERLTTLARNQWDEIHRHPWLLQADKSRPWIGPNVSDRYEWHLSAIEGAGLTDLEMDQVVTLITGFAEQSARASVDARRAAESTGISDVQWWEINAPVLEQVMPADRYPLSGRVGTAAGQEYNAISDPERSFRFGLDRIIDGLENLLKRPNPEGRNGRP